MILTQAARQRTMDGRGAGTLTGPNSESTVERRMKKLRRLEIAREVGPSARSSPTTPPRSGVTNRHLALAGTTSGTDESANQLTARDSGEAPADWTSLVDHVSRCVRHLPSRFVREQDRDDLAQTVLVRLLRSFHRPLDVTVEPVWSPSYLATCVRNEARRAWRHRSTLTGSTEIWAPERLDATTEVAVSSAAEGSARDHADSVDTRHRPDRPFPRVPGQVPAAFSPFQSRVIELKLAGLSIHAIAKVVDRQRSQVQAAWKQVQRKLPGLAPTMETTGAKARLDMGDEADQVWQLESIGSRVG